jgi:hypothetical protein
MLVEGESKIWWRIATPSHPASFRPILSWFERLWWIKGPLVWPPHCVRRGRVLLVFMNSKSFPPKVTANGTVFWWLGPQRYFTTAPFRDSDNDRDEYTS